MSTWDGNNFYFSGQGVVLIGERDALGKAKGLRPVGNVTALAISIATEVLEHKESQTGQRAIDLRLTTETNATLTATLENFIAENLRVAMRGSVTEQAAGTVTSEDVTLYAGKVAAVEHIKLSNFALASGSVPLTLYTDEDTPWDYKLNTEAGSVLFNDGQGSQLVDALGDVGAGIVNLTVGTTTVIELPSVPSYAEVGGYAYLGNAVFGVAPTAGDPNDKAYKITAIDTGANTVTLDLDTSGGTYSSGGALAIDGATMSASYSFDAYNKVDSLTEGSKERYLRFEGLNTADDLRPVVVEVFKFAADPLQDFSLISDEVQAFELTGNVLADALQTTGSKFFKVQLLR